MCALLCTSCCATWSESKRCFRPNKKSAGAASPRKETALASLSEQGGAHGNYTDRKVRSRCARSKCPRHGHGVRGQAGGRGLEGVWYRVGKRSRPGKGKHQGRHQEQDEKGRFRDEEGRRRRRGRRLVLCGCKRLSRHARGRASNPRS